MSGQAPHSPGSPEERKQRWRRIYDYMATVGQGEFHLMNYGFAGGDAIDLAPEEEPERLSLQLYRRVCAPAALEGRRVLEVGCGRGGGAAWIARALRPAHLLALDFSMEAIEVAQRGHGGRGSLVFLQGDAEALPFPADSLDVVVNVESSHCYSSRPRFFAETRRVLAPSGSFVLADFFPREDDSRAALERAGFEIAACEDITPQVLEACALDADRRRASFAGVAEPRRTHLAAWAGVPGSPIYRELETGRTTYLAYHLR